MKRFVAFVCCLLLGGLWAPAQSFSTLHPGETIDATEAQYLGRIQAELKDFGEWLDSELKALDDALDGARMSRAEKKHYAEWRGWVAAQFSEILDTEDVMAALLDVWSLAVRLDEYAGCGEAAKAFGRSQNEVQKTTARIQEKIEVIAEAFLPGNAVDDLRERIEEYVRENPLRDGKPASGGLFDFDTGLFHVVGYGNDTLNFLAKIPLAPLNMASGVQKGGQAMSDINVTAERFVTAFETTPERLRSEVEILLKSSAAHEARLIELMNKTSRASGDIEAMLLTADGLSTSIQSNLEAGRIVAERFDSVAARATEAVREARLLTAAIEQLREQGADSASSGSQALDLSEIAGAAQGIESGAAEIRAMLADIEAMRASGSKSRDPQKHGFDVREYNETAQSIEQGAAEIRALLGEIRQLNEDPELAAGAGKVAGEMAEAFNAAIDHAAARIAQLLVLAAALAAVLIVLARRFRKSRD